MFGLGYWAFDKLTTPGIGQISPHALTYNKGKPPPTVTGQRFCGDVEAYRDGLVYPPGGQAVAYDAWGVGVCCREGALPAPQFPPIASTSGIGLFGVEVSHLGGNLGLDSESVLLAGGDLGLSGSVPSLGDIGLDGGGPNTGDLGLDSERP